MASGTFVELGIVTVDEEDMAGVVSVSMQGHLNAELYTYAERTKRRAGRV